MKRPELFSSIMVAVINRSRDVVDRWDNSAVLDRPHSYRSSRVKHKWIVYVCGGVCHLKNRAFLYGSHRKLCQHCK